MHQSNFLLKYAKLCHINIEGIVIYIQTLRLHRGRHYINYKFYRMVSPDIILLHNKKYIEILFPYAYNILGSVEDAKDMVQDTLVKFLTKKRDDIEDVKNYLIKSVINRSIDFKKRQKINLRAGEMWLPEPIATDDNPDKNLYLDDILSYSLLVLMERLNAKERAVFILKETFEYTHREIAGLLSMSEDNSRTLLHRAKAAIFKAP